MPTLAARTARELMTPGSFSLPETATIPEASAYLMGHTRGAAVVVDDAGHPLGVVTKTDLVAWQRDKSDRPHHHPIVRDIMTPATFTVPETLPAADVVKQMIELNVHHLFVVDAAGTIVGAIEPMNVLRKLA
jgi:CBS domain-containing protein